MLSVGDFTKRPVRGKTLIERLILESYIFSNPLWYTSAFRLYACISMFLNLTIVNGTSVCNCKCLLEKGYQVHSPLEIYSSFCTGVNQTCISQRYYGINLLLFVRNSYRIWISTLEDPLVKWFLYKEKKYGHITGVIPNLPQDSSR